MKHFSNSIVNNNYAGLICSLPKKAISLAQADQVDSPPGREIKITI
jgi:hypothetical protein